jgi:enoyl-[acyl-carrier-protein] reductase (NADH)
MGKRAKLFGKDVDTYLQEVIEESPQKRLITAREVGGMALFLMSPEARGITGQSLNVCGGVSMGA